MKPKPPHVVLLALALALVSFLAQADPPSSMPAVPAGPPGLMTAQAALPLAFEANRGQTDPSVAFLARSGSEAIFLTREGVVVSRSLSSRSVRRPDTLPATDLPPAVLRVALEGASPLARLEPESRLAGVANYYKSASPATWIEGVPCYGKVRYRDVRPGVDWVFYGDGKSLEYDLVLAPGVQPSEVLLRFRGVLDNALRPALREDGSLLLSTPTGDFVQPPPRVWQERGGERVPVASGYRLESRGRVGFRVGPYDRSLPLVIDPYILFSTYLGGSSGDTAESAATDPSGSLLICGTTASANFPSTDGSSVHGSNDAFVAKFNASGSALIYSTVIGGTNYDNARSIAVDSTYLAYVAGETTSPEFPTLNGYPYAAPVPGDYNGFLLKLSASGTLLFGTRLQGSSADHANAVAIGFSSGFAYVAGSTQSSDFPVTVGALQSTRSGPQDAFLTFVNTNTSGPACIPYSTYFGGSGSDDCFAIATDFSNDILLVGETSSGNFPVTLLTAYQPSLVTAPDAWMAAINVPLVGGYPVLNYATYFGGNGSDSARAVAAAGAYGVYVMGDTTSTDLPQVSALQPGFGGGTYDGFLAFFDTGQQGPGSLWESTYWGGSGDDFIYGVSRNVYGNLLVAGTTSSTNFPLLDPIPGMGTYRGGPEDAFLTYLAFPVSRPESATAQPVLLAWSTFLGGTGDDFAEAVTSDSNGDPTVVGGTNSPDFPRLNAVQSGPGGLYDGFITKVALGTSPCSVTCTASALPTGGAAPLPVSFSATATPTGCTGVPTYAWTFGDGDTSTAQNPVHTYLSAGNYSWGCTVTVDAIPCTKTGSISVGGSCSLTCSASAPSATTVGEPVPFASSVSPVNCPGPVTYLWDFGDGSTDTTANPTYTYSAIGNFTWTFTASANGVDCVKSGNISVCDFSLTASSSPLAVFSGQTVHFSSSVVETPAGCADPLTYLWDFGDGSTSAAANPNHVYVGSPGYKETYYWTLSVTASPGRTDYAWGSVDVDGQIPGKVYAWGSNAFGQVGDGSGSNQWTPVALTSLPSAYTVAAGTSHSLAVKGDQTIWAWGKNDAGQLGDGTYATRTTPVQVSGLSGMVGVAAGGSHSLALKNDRTVWAWGLNTSGQLGDGTVVSKPSPVQVPAVEGASTGAAGGQHSLAIVDYQLYAWGDNTYGQVGDGTNTNRPTPVPITSLWLCAEVAAGDNHSLALQINDGIQFFYAWGLNDHGQLGNGTTSNANAPQLITALSGVSVEAIAAGANHSLALTSDGEVYAWGANESGQLGDGTYNEQHTPVLVPGLTGIVGVAAGGSHSLFLASDGSIWACGANVSGQLGHGDNTPHPTPVKVLNLWGISGGDGGGAHSVAVAICVPLCDGQGPSSVPVGTPAAFTSTVTTSTACTGPVVYDWDFGDGTSHSSLQNPEHAYALAGSYNWTLTATVNGSSCTSYGTILVCSLTCTASVSAPTAFPPLLAQFTGSATLTGPCPGPVTYLWDFGDGSATSTVQNPSHTYSAPGTFTWTMTASASGLSCQRTGTVEVCGVECTASASPRYGMAPLSVGFTATASPSNQACLSLPTFDWDFGDGTAHGLGPLANHTYTDLGRFTWTMTATMAGVSCTKTGTILVTACTLNCSAAVAPDAGTPDTTFTFDASASSPDCSGPVTYDWDFGDGTAHGALQTVTHRFASPGQYDWTVRVMQGGVTCLDAGTVYVTAIQPGSLQGFVGICAEPEFRPLTGTGVHQLQVFVVSNGTRTNATMSGASYSFTTLPPGTYQLMAEMQYDDHILYANDDAPGGCPSPGIVPKFVTSVGTEVVIDQGSSLFQNVCFAPPLVFLHGASGCYTLWDEWDAESRNLQNGRISFTPNYHWWGDESSWGEKADQVFDQISADLFGLVGSAPVQPQGPQAGPIVHWPPYYTVAYDMGGLVIRVLTSGFHQFDAPIAAMRGIYLLGVPNSGSDFLLGNGSNDIMSVQAITRRFNIVYPDYGALNDMVYVIGGTHDLFGSGNSDGRVDLYSAFTIEQVGCSPDAFGYPVCKPFAYLPFDSDPAEWHLFDYSHEDLVSAASMAALLDGIILPGTQTPVLKQKKAAVTSGNGAGDPETPVGQSVWGTNNRTTGSTKGKINPHLAPNADFTTTFKIGATDGMAVYIFVTSGSGQFELVRPGGTTVALGAISGDYVYSELSPTAGTWTFNASAGSSGVTFSAAFVENSIFGVHGYAASDHYNPGDTVTLRLDMQGDLTGVTVSSVQAEILDLSGNPLVTVTLSPTGGPGSGAYSGTWIAPSGSGTSGAYPVTFSAFGTYLDKEFARQAFDTVNVLPPAHVFTGAFSDLPLDRNADGLYDAIRFTAQLNISQAGYFVMSADLFDEDGNYLDTASAPVNLPAGPGHLDLTFDLTGAFCSQFDRPFHVQNLRFVDAFTLNPLDVWSSSILTASYASGTFQCLPGLPPPKIQAAQPDQGVQGQALTLLVSGRSFKPGATLAFDSGITIGPMVRLNEGLLQAAVTIAPSATLGYHALTLTNLDGSSYTAPSAFAVGADMPPSVQLTTPETGQIFQPPSLAVTFTAAASDDIRVTRVELKLDGALVSSDSDFPFTWTLPLAPMTSGSHTVVATAYDTKNQHTDSAPVPFTYFKNPPTVSSVTGGGSPWQLKIIGTNFASGVTVFIGSDTNPWSNTVYKNSTKVVLKGGKLLKARFPSGQPVTIRIHNPDGSEVSTAYTRP